VIDYADGMQCTVDMATYSRINDHFLKRGNDLVVDYEHQTLSGDKAPAAGWIYRLSWDEAQGIIAHVNWTATATGLIRNKEYLYHSPTFMMDKDTNEILYLHSVALTNTPKTNNLKKIEAKERIKKMEWRTELIKILGLSENASDDEILSALTARTTDKEATTEDPPDDNFFAQKIGMSGKDVTEIKATLEALKQSDKQLESVMAQMEKMRGKLLETEVAAALDAGFADGKLTADMADWAKKYAAKDMEGFKMFLAKAPKQVSIGSLEPGEPVPAKNSEINDLLGITSDDVKKYEKGVLA